MLFRVQKKKRVSRFFHYKVLDVTHIVILVYYNKNKKFLKKY